MARQRLGRIALARVRTPVRGALTSRRRLLGTALVPGSRVERYGREWRMGAIALSGDAETYYEGRIGFQRVTGRTELFDEHRKEFTQAAIIQGASSAFSLDVRSLIVAFQLRPGVIKRSSFTGAFQGLLTEGSQLDGWEVRPLVEEETLEGFQARVEAITELRVRIKEPNPDWSGRDRLRRISVDANAEVTDIVWHSSDEEGVDTAAEVVREAIDHAYHRGYGHLLAHGREHGHEIKYDSRTDTAPPEVQAPASPETGEVPFTSLRDATGQPEIDAGVPSDEEV